MGEFKQDFLKNYVDVISGVAFKSDEFIDKGIPVVKIGNISNYTTIKTNYDSFIDGRNIENYRDYLLALGNVLIAMSGNTTCKMGKVSADFSPSLLNQRVGWIKPLSDEINIDFIYHLLISESYQKKLWTYATATGQPNLSPRDIKRIIFPKPPKLEQTAIATILSKVDEAIEATIQSIKATEKLKKALMQNLLSGKLKPDGTWRTEDEFYEDEKCGKIPKGWIIAKGNKITDKITKGQSPKWQGFEYQDSGILFVTSENVQNGFIDIKEPKYLPLEFHTKIKNSQLKKGDILINIVGASIGRCSIFDLDVGFANTNQAVCVFRLNDSNNSEFICYYLQNERTQRRLLGTQVETARANLSLGDFRKFKFVIPENIEEQKEIGKRISKIQEVVIGKQSKIKTLERLKKSLMQQLLTGKKRLSKETITHINQTF
ncbi:restriction endonuclease subunit S [Elizabethkingia anophelis]|nr:restriction endonuclease subunit S [Elizabethkingia anophelis]MCT4231364.1 restriction endonuclease subunit S [Elizabethkingia anophelis]